MRIFIQGLNKDIPHDAFVRCATARGLGPAFAPRAASHSGDVPGSAPERLGYAMTTEEEGTDGPFEVFLYAFLFCLVLAVAQWVRA